MFISIHTADDPDRLDELINREIGHVAREYNARFCDAQFRAVYNPRIKDIEYSALVTYSEPADKNKKAVGSEPTG